MLNPTVQFTCSECRECVNVCLDKLKVVTHEASTCHCEYCGWDIWYEFKVTCPACGVEVSSL